MALQEKSIRELNRSFFVEKPWITFPAPAPGKTSEFKLRSCLLQHLPTFHGLPTEDPIYHLKQFEFACTALGPPGADENILKLKAFFFSLADEAKDWLLYHLPSGVHITSWELMKMVFLEKYSPTSRVLYFRNRISAFQRGEDESLPAYYERFKSLIAQCPQHQMEGELLVQHFYEGLILHEEKNSYLMSHPSMKPWNEGLWNFEQYHDGR